MAAAGCVCLIGGTFSNANESEDIRDTANEFSSQSPTVTARMSISAEFDMLYQTLKETQDCYYTDVMKALALLIVALGWFITSNKSRAYFTKNKAARVSLMLAGVLACVIHSWYCIGMYYSSQMTMSLLNNLNYIDLDRYSSYAIDLQQVITNLIMIVSLFAALIVILWTLKEESSPP